MKQLLALLTLLLLTTAVNAQKLVVRDFKAQPLDQTAINPATSKKDQNGKTAALIKIYTTLNTDQTYFDNGVMGVVSTIKKPGQIWLYIPSRSQAIQIINAKFQPLTYVFGEEIAAGKTYSMLLTSEGKEVTLSSSVRHAIITVDGDTLGASPQNIYLSYGEHIVRAEKGSMLYDGDIMVTPDGPIRFELPMEDENLKFSDVTVRTSDRADIYFQGEKVATGEWKQRLRGGHYSIELKKENHEPRVLNFEANAGKPTTIFCQPLDPHKGFLNIEIHPTTGTRIMDGDTLVAEHRLQKQLNTGRYTYTFRKKGYEPQTRTFTVARNEATNDTVELKRIQYIRSNAFYAGVGFTYGTIYGISAHAGAVFSNINIEVGYTLGLGKSNTVYWYEAPKPDGLYNDMCTYSMDELEVKAGYQFSFVQRVGLTPQVGYMGQRLRGGIHGNGAMCHNATIGARLVFNPLPNVGIFVNPEYAVPVKVNDLYKDIAETGGFSKGGFYASAGLTFCF